MSKTQRLDAARNLAPLFRPASVAVIGAGQDRHRIRGKVLHTLKVGGFAGKIFPVNPGHATVQGLPAYPDMASLPQPVDLAMIVVPAELVPGALEDAAAAGTRAAVVFTAGPAEAPPGEKALHERVAEIATRTGMRILGPNTEGYFNVDQAVACNFSIVVENEAGVASRSAASGGKRVSIVSQSGGLGFGLYSRGRDMEIPFRYVITTGNEGDVSSLELVEYLIAEGESAAILMFIEGFRHPERFAAVASAAADAGVPLIVMKSGSSAASQRAAVSHTAHLTGVDTAYDAAFERYGVIRVRDPEEMLATAAAFCQPVLPKGNRVAILTGTGGTGAWIADLCAAQGLDVPPLQPELKQKLAGIVPKFGSAENPIDVTASMVDDGGRTLANALALLREAPELDVVVVIFSFAPQARIEQMTPLIGDLLKGFGKPVLFVSQTLPGRDNLVALAALGCHHYSFRGCACAIASLVRYAEFQKAWSVSREPPRVGQQRALPPVLNASGLNSLLSAYDIPLPPEALVSDAHAAAAAAARIGFPVALKVQSPDIPHKTDAGALALDLRTEQAVSGAFDRIMASARAAVPGAIIEGVQVQRMMPPGHELVVGVIDDADFGPLLMLGTGGIYVDVLKDIVFSTVPVTEAEALAMVRRLKGAPILFGARGTRPADVAALARLLTRVSHLAQDAAGRIAEIDLNPVIVYPQGEGVVAVDALLRLKPQGPGAHA
jgi:acyl-CoA synthetase (NDP forming)